MIGNNSQTVARRDYNRIFSTLALRFFLGVLLTTLCLRDYLFGNGLYLYRDWTWPLSTGITPVANFSPDIIRNVGPDPLGFVRMFFTWPVVIIDGLTTNPILAEKVYIVYLFSIFMFFIFVFAELLLRVVVRETSFNPAPWKREVFVLSTVLFCVTNFWSLQQLSDLY